MQKLHHRIVLYVLIAAAVTALLVQRIHKQYTVVLDEENARVDTLPQVETATPTTSQASSASPTPVASSPAPTPGTPKTLLLKIPFTSQAPTTNWDDPIYAEGCEEASSIMANQYLTGNTDARIDVQYALDEIKRLADWEEAHFGYHLDINTVETAQMIEEVYGLKTKIVTDFSEESLKQELNQNHVILFPANGKLLKNPNFRSGGPPYHMIVLRGYDSTHFISNDPGTRNGLNYPYTYKTLYEANGDFSHDTHLVDTSKKMVIMVWSEKQATISAPGTNN